VRLVTLSLPQASIAHPVISESIIKFELGDRQSPSIELVCGLLASQSLNSVIHANGVRAPAVLREA
jgi:hypothetical protein